MIVKILTANDHIKNYEAYILKHVRLRWKQVSPIAWNNAGGNPAYAYILKGTWVVGCECGECIYYEPGRAFFCPNCLNGENQHRPRPVIMPEERNAIEVLLLQRPNPLNRNWLLGETIAQLREENAVHIHKGG